MHLAPLSILIPLTLLILFAEPFLSLPVPLHLCAGGILVVSLCAWRRRESSERTRRSALLTEIEQEAARCTRRYHGILEGAGNALFIFNAENGLLEESNGAAQELLGFTREEMSALQGKEFFPAGEQEKFRSLVYRLKRRGSADPVDLVFQRKDGSRFLGEVEARLLELGSERLVAGIVRDISEKRRAEGELQQRNRELSILNALLATINEGKPLPEVMEETLTKLMEHVGAEGGAVHLIEEDGAPAPTVSRQVSPHLTVDLAGCIGRGMERCGSINSCGAAETESCRLAPAAASEGWGRLFAVPLATRSRLIGVMHLLHRQWHPYSEEEIRFLTTVGQQMGNALEQARLFAELDWKSAQLMRSHRLLETSSRSLAASEIKLKQNLALVEQANADLKRVSAMKNQFLGLVSHEFNTPLTSIIAGTDHLLQQGCAEEDEAVLRMVRDGGLRLKDLVGDLLNLIKLEAKEGVMVAEPVHLKGELELVREQLAPALAARNQSLILCGLENLPSFVGDWKNLERVFGELLENAMKFTPDGGEIRVSGRVVDGKSLAERRETLERFNEGFLARCGNRCYLEVEVRDNGIGIPPQEQQRVFQIFYEIGDVRHHSSGKGAGLGLAIVKGMVEAHGGMVWVESDKGSSFFLLLPLEQELSQPELF
ncbi:ATP-binding protein [Geomonas sp. RF6]|uniref:sensor histidine kinase n=1 Tax=Geomonas sp. RF6 TaxID=2897342 RepID=UPI001E595D0C|nr:ATP-binding protein [Geomonas sp. RF6]UFS71832.1 ATP-binding protein [Geomonas sp. RF6]